MKTIKILFCNFWKGFNVNDNIFIDLLSAHYNVRVINEGQTPDLIIYSNFGSSTDLVMKYPYVKKLYFSGENDYPDFNACDYAVTMIDNFGFDRHLRIPLWVFDYYKTGFPSVEYSEEMFDRKFCSYVVSNGNCADINRDRLFHLICDNYKKVDSGGRYLNNIGGNGVDDKQEFIKGYKFNLAFENSVVDGYNTEKISDAYAAGCVPIYYGSPSVLKDFNPDSFIMTYGMSDADIVDRIREIDSDKNKYMDMLNSYLYNGADKLQQYVMLLEDFLCHVIEGECYNHVYGRIGMKNCNNKIIC